MSSSTPKYHVCATCGRQYQRSSHLRRHEATHSSPNRFKCCFCGKEFSRSDVCKKHCLACPRKDAVDAAATANLNHDSATDKAVPGSIAGSSPSTRVSDAERDAVIHQGMPFLRQICNPHAVTMQHYLNVANNDDSFNESVPDSAEAPDARPGPSSQDISDVLALLPPYHTAILDQAISALVPHEDFTALSLSASSPIPALTDAGYEVLAAKAVSIVAGLRTLHDQLLVGDTTFSGPHDIDEVAEVFCADKIRFFAAAFFRLTHVHFPLVHCATFGVPDTSAFLILAVVVFGASRCAASEHTIQAKSLTGLAEEYIFREVESFNDGAAHQLTLSQLQTIQAAVAMTNLMMNHNDWSLRERARLKRLPTLIFSIRRFQLTTAISKPTLDWHQFILGETAARIATLTAVIDWNQARMFYCPPGLSVAEMRCTLPCHREIWEAPNAAAWMVANEAVDQARRASAATPYTSISVLIAALVADRWSVDAQTSHLNLTLESLSAVSYAMTALTVSACQMLVLQGAHSSILRAISRWRELWDHVTRDMDPDVLLKAGLTRHCHENCTLAWHIAEAWLADPTHAYFQTIGHRSLIPISTFIESCEYQRNR